jgi:hypothetical protein
VCHAHNPIGLSVDAVVSARSSLYLSIFYQKSI